jgi:F420-non-reducing hydrogenase iron-sulfur subunit
MIYLFHCSNSLPEKEALAVQARLGAGNVKLLSLPCSGKVAVPYLLKAFEKGADGVVVLTCVPNECRHLEGNLRASKRAAAVETLLEEVGLGAGRTLVLAKEQGDTDSVIEAIERFLKELKGTPMPCRNVRSLTSAGTDATSRVSPLLADKADRRETAA